MLGVLRARVRVRVAARSSLSLSTEVWSGTSKAVITNMKKQMSFITFGVFLVYFSMKLTFLFEICLKIAAIARPYMARGGTGITWALRAMPA